MGLQMHSSEWYFQICTQILTIFSDLLYPNRNVEADHVHRYLKSTHNIVIEKGWWRLHTFWGDNVVAFFEQGIEQGVYNIDSPGHQYVHINCLSLQIIYY